MELVLKNYCGQILNGCGDKYASEENRSGILYFTEKKIKNQHAEAIDRTAWNVKYSAVEVFPKNHIHTGNLIQPADK